MSKTGSIVHIRRFFPNFAQCVSVDLGMVLSPTDLDVTGLFITSPNCTFLNESTVVFDALDKSANSRSSWYLDWYFTNAGSETQLPYKGTV